MLLVVMLSGAPVGLTHGGGEAASVAFAIAADHGMQVEEKLARPCLLLPALDWPFNRTVRVGVELPLLIAPSAGSGFKLAGVGTRFSIDWPIVGPWSGVVDGAAGLIVWGGANASVGVSGRLGVGAASMMSETWSLGGFISLFGADARPLVRINLDGDSSRSTRSVSTLLAGVSVRAF